MKLGKEQKKKPEKEIPKEKLTTFLENITSAIDHSFSGKDSHFLEEELGKEFEKWCDEIFKKNKKLKSIDFKAGVCLGLKIALNKINENENENKRMERYIA